MTCSIARTHYLLSTWLSVCPMYRCNTDWYCSATSCIGMWRLWYEHVVCLSVCKKTNVGGYTGLRSYSATKSGNRHVSDRISRCLGYRIPKLTRIVASCDAEFYWGKTPVGYGNVEFALRRQWSTARMLRYTSTPQHLLGFLLHKSYKCDF